MLALAIHCTADGGGAGSRPGRAHFQVRPGGALLSASLVPGHPGVHKVPEGLALGRVASRRGIEAARGRVAVFAAVEATTLLGGVLGVGTFFRGVSGFWLDAVVAHVGGWFPLSGVSCGSLARSSSITRPLVLVNFGIGCGVIAALTLLLRTH